jgi:DNA-binding response OmpR family regulator
MAGKKILLVDDSINLTQALKKRFEFELKDVSVFIARNGTDGLALAKAERPDLIILDVNMPDMNGDIVLKKLKSADEGSLTKHIPVIILTSNDPEEKPRFIAAGALDYITSPFSTDELVAKVKKILS